MELVIEKTSPHLAESWYQAYIVIYDGEYTVKNQIGRSYPDYNDCRINMEEFIEALAKNGVNILHDGIYKYYR